MGGATGEHERPQEDMGGTTGDMGGHRGTWGPQRDMGRATGDMGGATGEHERPHLRHGRDHRVTWKGPTGGHGGATGGHGWGHRGTWEGPQGNMGGATGDGKIHTEEEFS